MPSSTSSSKYLIWFSAAAVLTLGPVYLFFMVFAPPQEWLFHRGLEKTNPDPESGLTLLLRDNCLLTNLVQIEDLGIPNLIAPRPAGRYLAEMEERIRPQRLILVEDQSLALFAAGPPPPPEPPNPFHWESYLDHWRDQDIKAQAGLLASTQEEGTVLLRPTLLRRLSSTYLESVFRIVIPSKISFFQAFSEFWKPFLGYFPSGDPAPMVQAFRYFGGTFLWPGFRVRLSQAIGNVDRVANAEPAETGCGHHSLARGYPAGPGEDDRFPMIRLLRKAQEEGAAVKVIILPYNPQTEVHCAQWYEPYLEAIRRVCQDYGWELADLRVSRTPELQALLPQGIKFSDDLHVFHFANTLFHLKMTELLKSEIREMGPGGKAAGGAARDGSISRRGGSGLLRASPVQGDQVALSRQLGKARPGGRAELASARKAGKTALLPAGGHQGHQVALMAKPR